MRGPVLFLVTAGLAVLGMKASAQEVHIKAPSTWQLDVSQSDFGGMPMPKSDTITVMSDTAARLAFRDNSVSSDGKNMTASYDGPEDGQVRPMQGSETKASFKTDGTSHWVYPDGATEDDRLMVSDDGKTITITGTLKDKDGKEHPTKAIYKKVG